ncbi:MAG: cobalt ECF transporter T component CbiQ [Sphingobacteriia bacterium]|nr:cobalt ECF transporter T component CbiQ [Sphingobacteriia bacterium]NCC37967.1 cobalt ECF transporter T component CbiQ [Gammaproteobacteria bacterium]
MAQILTPVTRRLTSRAPGAGPLAGLDPRTRIIVAVAHALVVISLEHLVTLLAALALAILLLLSARLPLASIRRRLAGMAGFMLMLLITLPLSIPGTPILELGPLAASAEGLRQALEILLKAATIALTLLVLVGSLDAVTLGHALARLRLPTRLVQLLLFTVRYIDVIGQEYARLRSAMRARCFRPGNDRQTYRSLGYLVGMLLVRSLERSERILAAMRCRGFQGQFHRLDGLALGPGDVLFALLAALALTALIALDP